MKTHPPLSRLKALVTCSLASLFLSMPSHSATLTDDATVVVSNTHDTEANLFEVSVIDGKAGYDGVSTGVFGDGTVDGYRFFNNPGGAFGSYANDSGGVVGVASATNTNFQQFAYQAVWTTSDPDSDPADFSAAPTVAFAQGVTGSIDISGFTSGTVYFIHGTFLDASGLDLTMSGAGQPDILATHEQAAVAGHNMWVTSFTFDDATNDYDSISYLYRNDDTDGSRGRFGAVVIVDGVGGSFELIITDYSLADDMITLSWTSQPGATYIVRYSTDLSDWNNDLDDSVVADPGETTTRTFDVSGLASEGGELFFRVERT